MISKYFAACGFSEAERTFARSENEAQTKRNRFAREIQGFAKSLIFLRPENAGFRGFEAFQGVMRFAKRFFEFRVQNVALKVHASGLAGLPLSRH